MTMTQLTTMMDKATLRRSLLHLRDALDAEDRLQAEQRIVVRLAEYIRTHSPLIIGLYYPIKSEVHPLEVRALFPDYRYTLPRINGERMQMHEWGAHTPLEQGTFGTMQPPSDALVLVPDLCIVPLVGFDRLGTRLGYGKGYYDRYVAQHPHILRIGVAFSCQEVHKLPCDAHDQRLHHIITEREWMTL
jgi:5-formyltetrahydrofolate cyclo-ligase